MNRDRQAAAIVLDARALDEFANVQKDLAALGLDQAEVARWLSMPPAELEALASPPEAPAMPSATIAPPRPATGHQEAQAKAEPPISPPGLETVLAFAGRFPLMGCKLDPDDGKYKPYRFGNDYKNGFTYDASRIQDLWAGRGDAWGHGRGEQIQLFRFEPGQGGHISIDLDRNHRDGKDGLQELVNVFRANGLPLPAIFKDLAGGGFPCYTLSPSGGLHLHFKYKGIRHYGHQYLAPAVELFHFGNCMTAAGSIKAGKGGYTLIGSLDDAPLFPGALERLLKLPAAHEAKPPRPVFTFLEEQNKGQPSLETLAQWANQDGEGGGRNDLCHAIAKRAARPEYTYTRADTIAFLHEYPATAGHSQIETTVESAFTFRGK